MWWESKLVRWVIFLTRGWVHVWNTTVHGRYQHRAEYLTHTVSGLCRAVTHCNYMSPQKTQINTKFFWLIRNLLSPSKGHKDSMSSLISIKLWRGSIIYHDWLKLSLHLNMKIQIKTWTFQVRIHKSPWLLLNMEAPEKNPASSMANRPRVTDKTTTNLHTRENVK